MCVKLGIGVAVRVIDAGCICLSKVALCDKTFDKLLVAAFAVICGKKSIETAKAGAFIRGI